MILRIAVVSLLVLLSACSTSRYSMKHDAAPKGEFDASQIPDAVPKWEPLSRGGNKSPYEVRGKEYSVMPTAEGYVEEGISSWYGLKFHGELTSNGEVYNMYEMTAAHKTLPLPSYVKVTNQENGKSIIVRVNDRGPFHSDRIIDLSYAAAIKLGFQKKGTARVKLEAITPKREGEQSTEQSDKLASFVQIAAFASKSSIEKVHQQVLSRLEGSFYTQEQLFIAKSPDRDPPIYRLRMGPFHSQDAAAKALAFIKDIGLENALVITRSVKGRNL